jgi:RNA polymerase sigma-70 factor (ECF subfamily)
VSRLAKSAEPSATVSVEFEDDVCLMLRVRNDEPGAFAELIGRYRPKVFGRCYRLLGDREEAEDLTQDVFLRLYRCRKHYQPRARFNTWLFHIAQNVVRNAIRSRRRRPVVRLSSYAETDEKQRPLRLPRTDRADCPSRPLERRELAGVVRAAVSDLGERQRTALELHQFQQRTYVQIANQLAMTPKAAKSLLYRARNQLRSQLSKFMESC